MFSGRIMAEARAAGAAVRVVRDPQLLEGSADTQAKLLLVDLNLPGAIEASSQWKKGGERRVVGFVSHEDGQTIAEARSAGIDQVLARSRFVQVLPELLAQKAGDKSGSLG